MKMVSIAEAKNHLPSLVHEVEDGETIELTRHGHPVAVMFSTESYQRLKSKNLSFANELDQFRKNHSGALLDDDEWMDLNRRDTGTGRMVEF